MVHCAGGYTTNLPLEDFLAPEALLVDPWNGKPLRGRPRRPGAPHRAPPLRLEERQVGDRHRAPDRGPARASGKRTATTPTATPGARSASARRRPGKRTRSGGGPRSWGSCRGVRKCRAGDTAPSYRRLTLSTRTRMTQGGPAQCGHEHGGGEQRPPDRLVVHQPEHRRGQRETRRDEPQHGNRAQTRIGGQAQCSFSSRTDGPSLPRSTRRGCTGGGTPRRARRRSTAASTGARCRARASARRTVPARSTTDTSYRREPGTRRSSRSLSSDHRAVGQVGEVGLVDPLLRARVEALADAARRPSASPRRGAAHETRVAARPRVDGTRR